MNYPSQYNGRVHRLPDVAGQPSAKPRYIFAGASVPSGTSFSAEFQVIDADGFVRANEFARDLAAGGGSLRGDFYVDSATTGRFVYDPPGESGKRSARADDLVTPDRGWEAPSPKSADQERARQWKGGIDFT